MAPTSKLGTIVRIIASEVVTVNAPNAEALTITLEFPIDYTEITKAFGAFFAIMNPFVNLPIFLALTSDFSVAEQRQLAFKVAFLSAIMCGVILLIGKDILDFFGVTIDQFRIAGGAVLAKISWSMLNGESVASHQGSSKEKGSMEALSALAFYPLSFPMIVGPGTIATLIIYASHPAQVGGLTILAAIVAAVLAILFVVLFFASYFGKILSSTMRVIMTRLMGMILLAISVELIVAGLSAVLPGLVS